MMPQKKLPVLLTCCFLFFPLQAADLNASLTVNNYQGSFLPGLTFSYEQSISENWSINAGLTQENYVENFLYGTVIYKTPQRKSFGGYFGIGALYTLNMQLIQPGYIAVAGILFPKNTTLQFSLGLIMDPKNIFLTQQQIMELKIESMPTHQKTALILRYVRKNDENSAINNAIAIKIHSTAYTPEKRFSLTAHFAGEVRLEDTVFSDFLVSARFGGAYRTKKAGSYGLFFDAHKSVYIFSEPFKFAIGFEYGIAL